MKIELDKAYESKKFEDQIYKTWEESGFFNPDNIKKYRICVSPNFNYYMSQESFKGNRGFQLPHVVKCLTDLPIPTTTVSNNPEPILSDQEKNPEIRRHYDCTICGKSLLLTTLEIFKHKKTCQ